MTLNLWINYVNKAWGLRQPFEQRYLNRAMGRKFSSFEFHYLLANLARPLASQLYEITWYAPK
jgi:hypothetical protein